jgi:RHS repeat-associated protein
MERLSDPGEVLPFIGTIDEIAAFDTVLDASQRAQLWNGGSGVFWSSEHNAWGPCGWSFAAMGPGRAARAAAPARAALGLYVPATEPERVVAQYVWGARPGHRDELILRDRDSDGDGSLDERLYCLMDYFNGISILDEEGAVQERYRYSAFGERTVMAPDFSVRSASDFDWEFAFHGQFLDTETCYYNYGYRYYSPRIGRWLSKDPIEEIGGANLYGFVQNSAVNRLDLLGLSCPLNPPATLGGLPLVTASVDEFIKSNVKVLGTSTSETWAHDIDNWRQWTITPGTLGTTGAERQSLLWHEVIGVAYARLGISERGYTNPSGTHNLAMIVELVRLAEIDTCLCSWAKERFDKAHVKGFWHTQLAQVVNFICGCEEGSEIADYSYTTNRDERIYGALVDRAGIYICVDLKCNKKKASGTTVIGFYD